MKKSSEKTFGIVFGILFLAISLWPLLNNEAIRIWSIVLAFVFLTITFLKPKLLKPLNNAWIKLGEVLGRIIAPIIMALVFFIILTPISLLVRALGKYLLQLKLTNDKSYWNIRPKNITTMNKQF